MTSIPTIDRIIGECKSLQPSRAFGYRDADYSALCTSRVYDRVLVDGDEVYLDRVDGRIGAGYVRVSTPKQRSYDGIGDGFSEPDQLQRIVAHFVQERQAFQIFSDVALSGELAVARDGSASHVAGVPCPARPPERAASGACASSSPCCTHPHAKSAWRA